MGLEPSFSRSTPAWPFAGAAALPLEPDDPVLAVRGGALQSSLHDKAGQGQGLLAGIDPGLLSPQSEPSSDAPRFPAGHAAKWPAAVIASCVLHATVALAFLALPMAWPAREDPTKIEGADQAGLMVIGNAGSDQAMAGDVTQVTLVPVVDPKPIETIQAEPVPVEAPEPVTQAPQPPDAVEKAEPIPADRTAQVNPEPEILAAAPELADSVDNIVLLPANPAPVEVAETPATQTAETATPEAIPTPQVVAILPEARPAKPIKREEKAQPAEKAEQAPKKPARKKATAGSGGAHDTDARRGVATGRTEGEMAIASSGGALDGIGNAAVSNYPGKVAAKLRHVTRTLSRSAQASARNNAQVSFVVGAAGDVRSVQLVKSSGSPGLDETALAIIQRAAPFPPIPAQAARESWAFTLPIGPF